MNILTVERTISPTIIALFCLKIFIGHTAFAVNGPQLREIAVMPLDVRGLTPDEGQSLRTEFLRSLRSTGRFEIMDDDTMGAILKEANFKNLEECTYSHCIADVGKVLGVQRVFHLAVTRRGKLYTVRARVVNSSNAEILHDATREHSGEFGPLLSSVIPEMAREIEEARLESWEKYKWYIVGGAVVVLATTIYFINKSLAKSANTDLPGQPNPGPID